MSTRLRTVCTAALVCCLVATAAAAQDTPLPSSAAPPANLAFVDGDVDLVHDGVAERAASGTMLLDGDLVRTANGRAEIVFADGTLLHLDHDTELELLSPVRLRLRGGRVMLRVSAAAATPYAIDTHAASVRFNPRGEYGLTADGRLERLELTVARGIAEVDDSGSRTVVRGGEMATILGPGGRVVLQAFNSARWDAFERWSNDRTNGFSTAASARALPYELRPYAPVLDSYGRWDYVAPHGNVWFPAVGAAWRPYYTGAWSLTRYGWTWIGHDPWAWPTHHFGRWGFTGASWYWIPTRVWGPAWVSWTFVPGYVSWCPLGFDGRAVVGFSRVSTWLRGGRAGDHPDFWPNYDPWRAWTVIPHDSFGNRRPVRTHAVDPTQLPEQTRRAMAGYAVPREGAASRDFAVPRDAAAPAQPGAVPRVLDAPRRGAVRNPNLTPAPEAPSAAAPSALSAPSAPSAPSIQYPPSYDRGAVERRRAPESERRTDEPRVYTPGVYAPRRAEPSTGRQESPPARAVPRGAAAPRGDAAPPRGESSGPPSRVSSPPRAGEAGGRVRSPGAAPPRVSDAPSQGSQPRPSSGSEGQAQGGATRRRPPG
jgi:hypothetical protein